MKKTLTILLILLLGLTPLLADDYYQLFKAAMQFNLAKTVPGHSAGWSTSNDGVHYNDADMIATIGTTQSQYGYMIEIQPVDGLYFKTRHDWSSRRPFRIEFVMRGAKYGNENHEDLCSTRKSVSGIGVCDAGGNVNRSWTSSVGSGIYPMMSVGTNDSFFLRMPASSVYRSSWIDVILVLPSLESPDDMIVTDEYYAEFKVLFYPLDANGNVTAVTQTFDLMLTGFYDGDSSATVSDYYQFIISAEEPASYFDLDRYKDVPTGVGRIFFSTDTRNSGKWGSSLPTNYEISVGSSDDPFSSGAFFFKRVGTEDRQNTADNSIYYTVDIIPDASIPDVTYSSGTDTKPIVNHKSGITGAETYADRKVQVPVVCTGNNKYGPLFGAAWDGEVRVKVAAGDVELLQSGVYRSTLYVHLVSTR